MNIVLINPPYFFSKRSDIVFHQCLGLLYISASLIKNKNSVVVIDSLWEGRNNLTSFADGTVNSVWPFIVPHGEKVLRSSY